MKKIIIASLCLVFVFSVTNSHAQTMPGTINVSAVPCDDDIWLLRLGADILQPDLDLMGEPKDASLSKDDKPNQDVTKEYVPDLDLYLS